MSIPTTPAALSAIASTLLTVILMVIPPARTWFAMQTAYEQRSIRGGVVIAVAVGSVYFGCMGVITGFTCTQTSMLDWVATVVVSTLAGMAGTEYDFGSGRMRSAAERKRTIETVTAQKLLE